MKEHQSASRSTQVIIIDSVFYHSEVEEEEEAVEVEEVVAVEAEEAVSVNVHREAKEASVEEKEQKKLQKWNLNLMIITEALLSRNSSGLSLNRRWKKLPGYRIKKEGNKRCKQKLN